VKIGPVHCKIIGCNKRKEKTSVGYTDRVAGSTGGLNKNKLGQSDLARGCIDSHRCITPRGRWAGINGRLMAVTMWMIEIKKLQTWHFWCNVQ